MNKKYFIIGNPVEHSLSPKIHNYWFKEIGIDAIYEKKKLNKNEYPIKFSSHYLDLDIFLHFCFHQDGLLIQFQLKNLVGLIH